MQVDETRILSWISYKGCQIFFANYRGLSGEELLEAIKENDEVAIALYEQGMRNLLVLSDVTDTIVDQRAVLAFMRVSKTVKPITKASAVVGVGEVRKVMLSVVNAFSSISHKALDSLEEAMEWLVTQKE